jgi:putative membrane-bound dehydrogenase-like protein
MHTDEIQKELHMKKESVHRLLFRTQNLNLSVFICVHLWLISLSLAADPPAWGPRQAITALKVPDGFTIELVAEPPLAERPIMACFDDRGRLYVSDSAGVNHPGSQLVKDPPHRILILEDTDGDGKFDKSTVFADKIVFPQGLLWHDGALYIASPPSFWKLQDTDGDGVADKRTELITGFALTGVSDDVHGACLGPDGRIYTCAGRFPHQLKNIDGKVFDKGSAPLLVRCRPDGSEAEVVGGIQGNGVEIAFTPEGEGIVSGTFYGGAGMRDALIHFVEGGDYPVLGMGIERHEMKSTGELLPPLVHMIATAPSGIMRYQNAALGQEYRDNLFCCYFNMHKVQRHILERSGATFNCRTEDFLVSSNFDFHPTDVLEDADGSLLVIDTGGWFRIGCPTSQIAKAEIRGGIYRIRRKGAPVIADPRGLKLNWESPTAAELAKRLDDPRPAVAERAIRDLAKRGNDAVNVLMNQILKNSSVPARRNAVWTLSRIDGAGARAAIRLALADTDSSVRQVAVYAAGLHRDADALSGLLARTTTDTPSIRREAASALGRLRRPEAAGILLSQLSKSPDRFLEHALLYALIQIDDRSAVVKALASTDAPLRRAALIALDQMPSGNLTPDMVLPLLDPSEPTVQKTALWAISHHPQWAESMRGFFRQWLAKENLDATQRDDLKLQLLAFCRSDAAQELMAEALRDDKTPVGTRLLLLEVMAQAPVGKLPPAWTNEIKRSLQHPDDRIVRQAMISVRSTQVDQRPALTRIDSQINFPEAQGNFAGTQFSLNFTVHWAGLVRIPRDGVYSFFTDSDDGSRLSIDGRQVVNNGGFHAMREKRGSVELKAGDHEIAIDYIQGGGDHGCKVSWSYDGKKEIIPPQALLHREKNRGEPAPGLIGQYYDVGPQGEDFAELNSGEYDEALLRVYHDSRRPAELRVAALSAAVTRLETLEPAGFNLLLACLAKDKPALLRASAADTLGRANLDDNQLNALIAPVAAAGPLEMPKMLAAYERANTAEVGRKLVAALDQSTGARSLRADVLRQTLKNYPPEVQQAAEPLLKRLSVDSEKQKSHLAELEPALASGDLSRGRAIFFGEKAACGICHTVQDNGGRVGPDLSKIASIRTNRDLLEAIVYPSSTFARGFEPYIVKIRGGDVQSGIITHETADEIQLLVGPRTEVRIARSAIKDMRQSTVSIMPEGFDTNLTRQELSDVIAFLQSLR